MVPDREMATNLYRIAQEATSNAVRHGHATKVEIRMIVTSGSVTLSIEDNGAGFCPDSTTTSGMGLRSMRYRAGVLNGTLAISKPATTPGTRITCEVPLPTHSNPDSLYAN